MQSDMRELLRIATPTAAVGAIATLVGGLLAGGEGAIGAAVGCVVVIVFMAFGMVALQWAAKTMPHLLQGMGLMIYSAQLVLLLVFILSIRNTSLFNLRAFALSLVVAVITWITVQTVRHARSKTLYVDPDADTRNRPGGAGGDRDE
ncbi:hypothetical protein HFP69_10575 [Streptomyces sp. ARC12]|uniref:hypothetical protein n=1 Tax=Streptomyces TaxID=1883 RepID=UPI00093E4BCF|nr:MULTISPECIES: hypothetical protein [Streptomyces]MCX4488514.1 hypothetical protein [Streptomyces anulatus]MCX4521284.1 hypothetical protein [Streptomyces anulatus]MCX4604160.1 hypothetical protein [Streptomyces anulatus]OKI58753.1 ATP synthase I [Streptomyces sp. CB00072]WSC64158.1 hypothetical protein OHA57_26940 [Streptomyces anulatus]